MSAPHFTLSSEGHILRFCPQGSLIEFSPKFDISENYHRTWKRGEIEAFSRRSRSRLNKKISMISRNVLPLFVTLTYHENIPSGFQGYKHHLDHFFIRLFQSYPDAGAIWKLEYQFRGYAHYHLLLWGFPSADKDFISELWHDIAGYGSQNHLKWHKGELSNGNVHCVQEIRSWGGVLSYAAKYFAKLDNQKVGGRVWGIRGSRRVLVGHKKDGDGKYIFDESGELIPVYKRISNVPFSKILEFRVSLDLALEFRQEIAKKLNFEFSRLGFWCSNFSGEWLAYYWNLFEDEYIRSHPPEDPPDWENFVDV